MNWRDVKDVRLAMQYIDILLERYDDPAKRVILLYDKFLMLIGCCEEDYGMMNVPDRYGQMDGSRYLKRSKAVSDSLADIQGGELYYIKSQFLLGIIHSGTKFLSSKIKLKEGATIYFKNVLAATEGDITNPYRLFASIWLGDYYKNDKSFIDGDGK